MTIPSKELGYKTVLDMNQINSSVGGPLPLRQPDVPTADVFQVVPDRAVGSVLRACIPYECAPSLSFRDG
jgi:hypothetical protein